MFGLFKKALLSDADQQRVVAAIQTAEKNTSGEVRVFVESKCPQSDPVERARQIFFSLKMEHTQQHNAVLVYVALKDHKMALYGDEGIYVKTGGDPYWVQEIDVMRQYFKKGAIGEGIAACVLDIGTALSTHFPYDAAVDKNELPDEIVFGD
jgi:uncharacterized membrane protein